jgi:hypothetical protein
VTAITFYEESIMVSKQTRSRRWFSVCSLAFLLTVGGCASQAPAPDSQPSEELLQASQVPAPDFQPGVEFLRVTCLQGSRQSCREYNARTGISSSQLKWDDEAASKGQSPTEKEGLLQQVGEDALYTLYVLGWALMMA